MANLKDIAKSKGIHIKERPIATTDSIKNRVANDLQTGSKEVADINQSPFQKRRTWLESDVLENSIPVSTKELKIETRLNDLQMGSKHTPNRVANDLQMGSKEVADEAFGNTITTPFKNKRVAKRVADQVANDLQTGSKEVAETSFDTLVGKERNLILFMADDCRLNGSLITSPMTRERIAEVINSSANRAKNIVFRLQEKFIIESVESKTGRGGWTKFKLEKAIFQKALIQLSGSKEVANDLQTGSKHTPNRVAERVAESPIVVVSNLNSKNTTNTQSGNSDEPCFVIPPELSGKVSRRQLSEFVTLGKISESDLQLSLDAFAYDLRNNLVSIKFSNNPVGLLIGAIKNNGSYNSAKYVESAKAELRPFIESQREASAQKQELKASKEWEVFQTFKQENPDDYKNLEQKVLNLGFKGALLEEFTYLEYKKEVLKVGEELNLNPLRPMEHITS